MTALTRGEQELLDQLPCFAAKNYVPATMLVDRGLARWRPGVRFGCGELAPIDEAESKL